MQCVKCGETIPDNAVFCHLCGKRQSAPERKYKKRPNGAGSIDKLSGNRAKPWRARKADLLVGTFKTRAEAQRALENLTDIDISVKYNMTFAQVYELWMPEHEREITENAKKNYAWAYGFCESIHNRKFRTLRTSDFQQIIIAMEKRGLSKSSCEKVLQLFGQLTSWAMREDIIAKDYSKFVTTVAEQKSEGVVLKPKTIRAVQAATSPAADIILILLATGCRPNEFFNALVENCHENYFIGGSKTKSGRDRVIPVNQIGMAAYTKILEAARAAGSENIIDGYPGNRKYRNYLRRDFQELLKEIGEDFTPYDCRHTFATLAQRSGVDPQALRRIMGHASLQTTDKYYTHLDCEMLLEEAAAIKIG